VNIKMFSAAEGNYHRNLQSITGGMRIRRQIYF